MKKQMKAWQLIMGCIICLGIISSMFMSRITITSGRVMDFALDVVDDLADEYKDKLDDDWGEDIQDALKDKKEDLKEDVEEAVGNKKFTRSSAQLIFMSKGGLEKFLLDLTGKDDLDSDDEQEVIDKLYGALFWPRMMLIVIYVLPILLIVLYLPTYFRRRGNLLAIISTWIYFLVAVASNILWYVLMPSMDAGKLADSLGDSVGGLGFGYSMVKGSVEGMLSSVLRHMLTSFTGLGIWVFSIGSLLLLVYSFLLLLVKSTVSAAGMWDDVGHMGSGEMAGSMWNDGEYAGSGEIAGGMWNDGGNAGGMWDNGGYAGGNHGVGGGYQDIPIMEDAVQQNYSDMVTQYGGEGYPAAGGMAPRIGKIRLTRGMMAGAEITCMPGEQIVVGRDPAVSDLVLSHRKVSRKHFVIRYTEETDRYDIFCFSENGIHLSTGGVIRKGQHASIARGTGITMADGEEAMNLE